MKDLPALPPILDWATANETRRTEALARPHPDSGKLAEGVTDIIREVRNGGDAALCALTRRLDGVEPTALEVDAQQRQRAVAALDPELSAALDDAGHRIEAFHRQALPETQRLETAPGLFCEARYLPISPVGLYIPGGTAPLLSSVLMLAIPARLAGCNPVVLCSPPGPDGNMHPAIMAAAERCGVSRMFNAGGAQAIAAMGFGTETIPACAKLFGPGNAWVTEAKQQVAGQPDGPARDLPAGPSEVLVIADGGADCTAVCWDLLSQAEHGGDSQVLLLSDDPRLLDRVAMELPRLAAALPRSAILERSLRHLRMILVPSPSVAVEISNRYAPEHLILNCREADRMAQSVTAAGSVFIGPWTPESLGDYCSGTNHVLPTGGQARACGGLSTTDFMRRMTLQRATPEGLANVGETAMTLARTEQLEAHRQAVSWRLKQISS